MMFMVANPYVSSALASASAKQVAAGDQDPSRECPTDSSRFGMTAVTTSARFVARPGGVRAALERNAPPPLFVAELPPLLNVTLCRPIEARSVNLCSLGPRQYGP